MRFYGSCRREGGSEKRIRIPWMRERKKQVEKKRRMIYNDDVCNDFSVIQILIRGGDEK